MKPSLGFTLSAVHRSPQTRIAALQCRYYSSRSFSFPCLSTTQLHERSRKTNHSPQFSSSLSLRHASSSTAKATKAKPRAPIPAKPPTPSAPTKASRPTAPSPQPNRKLNPPPETYAPPLSVPPRSPGQSYFSYLWGAGRAYITFYKTAISHVRQTAQIAKILRERAAQAQSQGADPKSVLTRAEWQIIRRSRQDMMKLPVFALMVLIFGEWTPLLVTYLTPIVPEPCKIPSQVAKELEERERRRRYRDFKIDLNMHRIINADKRAGVQLPTSHLSIPDDKQHLKEVLKSERFGLLLLGARYDSYGKVWDRMNIWPPKALLKWGVMRKSLYIDKDDLLIERDGGWEALGREEMWRACVERGIDVQGRTEAEMKRKLAEWFEARKGVTWK